MKKSIAVILALILMMTAVFFGCGKKEEEKETDKEETTQQTGGSEDTTVSDDITLAPPASNDVQVTESTSSAPAATPNVSTPSSSTSTPEGSTNPSQPAQTPSNPSTPNQPSTPSQSPSYISGSKIEKFNKIFSSGTYSMTMITITEGVEDIPVDIACKNGNVRMSMSMEGIPATLIYRADNDTAYMLFEMMGKFYTELTEELMGEEIDFSEATKGFEVPANGTLTTSSTTFDGKSVTAETITSEGKTAVFYFDAAGNLLGTESTDDGEKTVTKISNFSATVNDSVFEIPKGYIYMDMSWLMGQ